MEIIERKSSWEGERERARTRERRKTWDISRTESDTSFVCPKTQLDFHLANKM